MTCGTGQKKKEKKRTQRSSDEPCHAKQTETIKRLGDNYFDTGSVMITPIRGRLQADDSLNLASSRLHFRKH